MSSHVPETWGQLWQVIKHWFMGLSGRSKGFNVGFVVGVIATLTICWLIP